MLVPVWTLLSGTKGASLQFRLKHFQSVLMQSTQSTQGGKIKVSTSGRMGISYFTILLKYCYSRLFTHENRHYIDICREH